MPLVSSLRGPWGESGRRATPSLGGWGECGPTLRQCLSFADPRNQAVRAVASRRVPGARSCQGACGLCPPDQKARPGGCLLRAPSAQLQPTWQPWPHPQGEGLDAIGCPGCWWPRPRWPADGPAPHADRRIPLRKCLYGLLLLPFLFSCKSATQ